MIGRRDAEITEARCLCDLLLAFRLMHAHDLAADWQLVLAELCHVDRLADSRFEALCLIAKRSMLALAEVRPVALAIPAHGRAIEIPVRLLPQVDVINRAVRMLPKLLIKRLHSSGEHCALPEARSVSRPFRDGWYEASS